MASTTLPEAGKKENDAGHGNRFQSKLLMLYAVRAINLGYQFYLGTELSVGEKFDDLIFHYKDQNDTYRQQYLQAKHRLEKNKMITAHNLLNTNDGDFSLLKYFQSFVKIRGKGNDIEHCIICTNVDFNHRNITNKGITLEPVDEENLPKLLSFKDIKSDQACYKLKDLGKKNILFENILNCVTNCTGEELKNLYGNCTKEVDGKPFNEHTDIEMNNFFINFQNQDQVEKKIIETVFKDSKNILSIRNWIVKRTGEERKSLFKNCTEEVNGKPFNEHTADEIKNFFINSRNQNQLFQKLVQIVFDSFLDNMIFSVKIPNETQLDDVLRNEVGKYFKLTNVALQSAHFMNEMVNWFKRTDGKHLWLTAEEAKDILNEKTDAQIKVIELTALSLDYQKQLKQIETSEKDELEFEDTVINQLTAMLQLFWNSQDKIKHFSSKTPKLTAVKVFSAIKKLAEFPNKDDYLVISSKRLKENQTEIKEFVEANINNGHRLLVVVNEEAENPLEEMFYSQFIPDKIKKKVIVISNQNGSKESYQDTITYGQLHENTKKVLRKRQVSFQGNLSTVKDLINMKQANEADNILDSQLIENLLQMAEGIIVPSFNTSTFGKHIERQLKFPSKDQLLRNLAVIEEKSDKKVDEQQKQAANKKMNEEIEIDLNGKFKWKTDDDKRKQKIWNELKILLEQNNSSDLSLLSTINEKELIDASNKRIIITDVAGTGKSTILSHCYEEIKKANPDKLVIKISLMNYSKTLMNEKSINEFLINKVMGQNAFARSLLKHRLETGDRIILMLDGFDEIGTECQDKVVELVKTLNESIPLYITTRPHLADQLQFELSQLAYRLDRFEEENQIDYLTLIWKDYLKGVVYGNEKIKSFAKDLIKRVSETLKDKEKEFIGIPLQCRILAECFQSKIKDEIIQDPNADLSHLIEGQQFDLVELYKSLINEKRRVFRQEKIEENSRKGHIAKDSIENIINKTERHLQKLAVQLIVNQQEDVNLLIPVGFQSESERKTKEKQLNEFGIRFGLVDFKGENGIQFLHRTFAEYLVADFIFNGFLLDDERHNKLLENESVRKWIIKEILVEDNYEGVRVFFDSMLKEIIFKKEWKSRIQNNHLPGHLQQFANFILEKGIGLPAFKTFHLIMGEEIPYKKTIPALRPAFAKMNSNISLLIFDCLDVTFRKTPSKITFIINNSLQSADIFGQRIDVFDRLLNYFDNAVNDHLSLFIELLNELIDEKQQIENKILERFLVFLDRHQENGWDFSRLTSFFTYSEMDEQTRRQFFEILTSKYSTDFELIRLMENAIRERLEEYLEVENRIIDWLTQVITIVLTIFRDLGRIEVAGDLSRYLLFGEFEIIKKEGNANIRLSLENMAMIGLHGAAFKGDLSLIEKEIGCSLENPENCSEEEMKSVVQLMKNDEDSFPPLYLAVFYGHDDICKKIFRFLDLEKEIDDKKGILHRSLKDAIEYENVVMIQTILKCVKEINGQNDLVKLLQSVIYYCGSKLVVETITSIVVQDTENGYRDLNDLVFYNEDTLEILVYVECDVLQKMIAAAGGFDNWIKRLMDTADLEYAFYVLSSDGFLDKLNRENQISRLIDILITKSTLDDNKPTEPSTSYWSDFVKTYRLGWFVEEISKCASEEDLKRLLFYRDDNNILILLEYLIRNGRDAFNGILYYLPENLRKEFEDLSEEEKPKLIDHFFSTPTFLESLDPFQQLNAIEYYLENGNEKQLAKFSQVVKVHLLEKNIEKTVSWIREKKGNKIAGLLKKKLDSQTVNKYKEFIKKYSS